MCNHGVTKSNVLTFRVATLKYFASIKERSSSEFVSGSIEIVTDAPGVSNGKFEMSAEKENFPTILATGNLSYFKKLLPKKIHVTGVNFHYSKQSSLEVIKNELLLNK